MKKSAWFLLPLFCLVLAAACDEENDSPAMDGDKETQPADGDGAESENLEQDTEGERELSPYECFMDAACPRNQVAAHRGYTQNAPENSLASVRAAAQLGADFVEIDTAHSKDGVIVLMHDSDVDRTTDGSGDVSDMNWAELEKLTLKRSDPNDPETVHIPRFEDVLALAKELGVMLYVDQGTDHTDEVLRIIEEKQGFETALIRDDVQTVAAMKQKAPSLLVMPYVSNVDELAAAKTAVPDLRIVEIGLKALDKGMVEAVHAAGLKAQQDAFIGDALAALGNYSSWKEFVEAGVDLIQTQLPALLIPAMKTYQETGVFPSSGPGDLK